MFSRSRDQGGLPSPRLLCASAYLPKYRVIYITGGWSPQLNGPVDSQTGSLILQMLPGTNATVYGKPIRTFDLVPSDKPSHGTYRRSSLGHWHGDAIKNPRPPVSDPQVLEFRRHNAPLEQHFRMVDFVTFSGDISAEEEEKESDQDEEGSTWEEERAKRRLIRDKDNDEEDEMNKKMPGKRRRSR